jgi:hypothetical protein
MRRERQREYGERCQHSFESVVIVVAEAVRASMGLRVAVRS